MGWTRYLTSSGRKGIVVNPRIPKDGGSSVNTKITHETTRRAFLQACTAGLGGAGLDGAFPSRGYSATPSPSANSILRIEPDPQRCWVPALSWDTEGGERFHRNLLRKDTGVGIRVRSGGQWKKGQICRPWPAREAGARVTRSGQRRKARSSGISRPRRTTLK